MKDFGLFSKACLIQPGKTKRASTWDKTGGNQDNVLIKPGENHIVLEENSAGCINHIYWTYISPDHPHSDKKDEIYYRNNLMRGFILKAYWDDSDVPNIEVPLGDFFGVSNGRLRSIKSLAFQSNPGHRSDLDRWTYGFNCYIPMPFRKNARIEIENQGEYEGWIWYHFDYEIYDNAKQIPENAGLLHACYNQETPTKAIETEGELNLTGDDNYEILSTEGKGSFLGYFLTVINQKAMWWGEGDDMIFIDDESFPPVIHGTGTEEIFGGGACPDTEYTGPYTGYHCIENLAGRLWYGTNGMYRFYINDPLRFEKSIRVTLEHGHANNLSNIYSSVAFWYQSKPGTIRYDLPKVKDRQIIELI